MTFAFRVAKDRRQSAPVIDLRSDTVTVPDKAMRAAMADAEVGDNVLGFDPTVRKLEERAAEVLGKPAALWTPTGTMANIVALAVHVQRGDRFLAPKGAHVLVNELGSAAWFAGGMPEALDCDAGPGRPSVDTVNQAIAEGRSAPYTALRTRMLCLENTHNAAGGAVTPPDEHAQLVAAATDAGLKVHLDGARIWNASVALGVPPAALTVGTDTVSVCLSKGLGAPAGSIVAGSVAFVERARRVRQMLGGGLHQAGVLAAAGLCALDNVDELPADHAKAERLAVGLTDVGWEVSKPETNIVLARVGDPASTLRMLRRLNVLALPMAGRIRFVTHRDVTMPDVDEVVRRIGNELKYGQSAS